MPDYRKPSVCTVGDEIDEYLDELMEQPFIESRSHAVRYCIRQQMQRDMIEDQE